MTSTQSTSNTTTFQSFPIWNTPVITQNEFEKLAEKDPSLSLTQLQYLATFGLLAPSTRNTIPERFRFVPEKHAIEVWLDRKRVLPQSDPTGRQAMMSIGCVLKNIEVAATAYQFGIKIERMNTTSNDQAPFEQGQPQYTHICTITFTSAPTSSASADKALSSVQRILERKVVRAEYDDTVTLDADTQTNIRTICQKYPQLQLHIFDQKPDLHTIGKYQEDADRVGMEDPAYTHELGEWTIENTDGNTPYGMRGYEVGFNDQFTTQIRNAFLQQGTLPADQFAALARGGKFAMESASAVIILSTANDEPETQLAAGEAYQEIVLFLLEKGFVHSIHAALTEVDWVRELFAATFLKSTNQPMIIFRVGVPKRASDLQRPASARPSLAEVTLPQAELSVT